MRASSLLVFLTASCESIILGRQLEGCRPFSPESQDSLREPQGLRAGEEKKEKLRPEKVLSRSPVAEAVSQASGLPGQCLALGPPSSPF